MTASTVLLGADNSVSSMIGQGMVLTEALAPGTPPVLPRVASHETIGTPWDPGEIPVDPSGDAERAERLRRLGYIE